MHKVFYFFLDSAIRRKVVQKTLNCPGADYMLYGADQLSSSDFSVHHNLEKTTPPSRKVIRLAWLIDHTIRLFGGSSGDFQTVLDNRRRFRDADLIVSTVDNVGVPLTYLNYFGLLPQPLLYTSIGLPERIASIKNPITRWMYRGLYRQIPQFISYGWEEAIRIREWLGLPPDSDRVLFIPLGVDETAFKPTPSEPIITDVLSIGADMQRDFQLLLAVATEQPSVSFQIITSSRHAATFGTVPPNVRILTNVDFQEISHHLAGARLMVIPCRENSYSSGTTTLLQAMAMAKPVVVTHTGAIRSGYHLENKVNCRLVTPGSQADLSDAILSLLQNPTDQLKMGAAARQTIESHLTWTHYSNRMSAVISAQLKQAPANTRKLSPSISGPRRMAIEIFEPELLTRTGFNGFYGFFLSALTRYKGATPTEEARPLPRITHPREHESAWIRVNGHLVFFDMSDHIFFYDPEALKLCDVYFKANLNWPITQRVLAKAELTAHRKKIIPFMFFADQLDRYPRHRAWNTLYHGKRRKYDVCHVTGVYMNPIRDGAPCIFTDPTTPITPANYHFWIRYQTQQALKQAEINGCYRLTSRSNKEIEDHQAVFPNMTQREFARSIFDSRMTLINTLPHAVLPWKATESLAMGRPLILDTAPLIEVPEPFTLKLGVHYLELFPNLGGFSPDAELEDPASYRLLTRIPKTTLIERAKWLKSVLTDHEQIETMTEQANHYAKTILKKNVVADYICDQIRATLY